MIRHYRGSHAPLRAVRALSRRAQITIGAIMVALGLATGGLMAAPASATTTGAGVLNTAQTALLIGTTPANVVHSTLGAGYQEDYAKLSLKKCRPMAARNEDRNVFSGLL